jgi:hypothetical protein
VIVDDPEEKRTKSSDLKAEKADAPKQ